MSTSLLQLYGCTKRTLIEKRRNLKATCCECCSHLILIFILVIGYGLSIVENFGARKYSDIDLVIPPVTDNTTSSILEIYTNITSGPLIVPTFDQYIAVNEFLSNNLNQLGDYGALLSETALGQTYTNLLYKGSLHFAPRGEYVDSLIEYMNTSYQRFSTIDVYIHDTEKAGISYILDNLDAPALALIVLREITPEKVNYVIRQNYTTLPNTNQVIIDAVIGLNTEYQDYIFSGFLSLERAINAWAFEYTNAISSDSNPGAPASCTGPPEIAMVPYPTAAYNQNPFYQQVGFLLGLAIVMSTMYPMSRLTKAVVEEKELRMREVMKIMGLRDWVHQLGWFLPAFVLFLWIAISSSIITRASFLKHSDGSIIFAYFFLFCMSEINFAFLVSVFFSNSKLAAIVAPVILFAGLMPRYAFLNTNNNELVTGKVFSCLLSPSAFAFGADMIASYEYSGVGIQYSNVNDGEFSFNTVLFMMWADFFIYGFLAWYLDQVIPHEFGSVQHPLFFLNPRFWWPRGRPANFSDEHFVSTLQDMPEFYDDASEAAAATGGAEAGAGRSIEAIPAEMRPNAHVRIKNLRKRYPDGNLAVRDFSLSMLEGQITCLLGHNGAGKTTTISALTGLIEATSGDVSIYGCSLRYDLFAIRQMTGICPQHNVLYPNLTVLEHLYFFGNVKGLYGTRLRSSIDNVIAKVGLTEKRDALSAALSGGMKRKLSLAIALIGDPKFLLLDEPTSGMDPYSRRSTWELLQKCKVGRVVLLTTHFMEEADTLADRIVIMSEGTLRCSGSSLFLKTRFGVGYLLSVSKSQQDTAVDLIEAVVKSVVADAKISSSIAGEVIFQMPLATVPLFADLFSTLRDSAGSLGVGAYGISLTTLEQVFISLAREAKHEHHEDLDDHAGDWQFWARKYVMDGWHAACASVATPATHPTPILSADIEMNGTVTELGQSDPDAPEATTISGMANEKNPGAYQAIANADAAPASSPLDAAANAPPVAATETGSVDGVSKGTPAIQFVELYRKRYIIASRDMKGLFFQLIFPALQIALIMLILTVSVNPAGRTIILNGDMFSKNAQVTPVVPVAGTQKDADLYCQALNPYSMTLVDVDAANSSALSDILLNPTRYQADRLGAYVFGDVISIDLSLNWEWVKSNLNGLGDIIDAIPGGEDVINNFLADNLPTLELNVTDVLGPTNVNFDQLNDFLESTFNVSLPGVFNVTNFNVTPSGTASVGSVTYNAEDNTFLLSDVTVEIQGNTVDLGDTTVSADQFALFLPDGIRLYEFDVPSRYTVMHNSTSPHGMAAFYSELVATAFQECSPTTASRTQYLVKNHPLPITTQQALEIKVVLALLTSIFILVPLCYIPASFVSFLVKERVSKSKHLQIVSSVSPYLYWTATLSWDVTLFLSLVGFILAAFFCFGSAADVFIHSQESTLALLCLLVTYGLGAIPLSYLYSMLFDNFSTAQISIMVINFMTGFVMVLAYYIMINVPSTEAVGYQLVHFFRFFPPYNVGEGLINLSVTYYRNTLRNKHIGYFEWEITGRNIVFMLVEGVGYFLAVLLTEFSLLQRLGHWLEGKRVSLIPPPPPPRLGVDQDVADEQERVKHIPIVDLARASAQSSGADMAALIGDSANLEDAPAVTTSQPACALLIRGLIKTYPPTLLGGTPKHAVRGVSLACSDGERFGLLGINGAGKTTILGILTGDLQPTAGEVYIGGKPLSDPGTMSMIGYCPQVDPLLDLMNAYETLWFFGRIRGIPKLVLERRVHDLIEQVGLERFAHKPCGTYSGGNKRKLSLAVALIGDPRVLFLDEPSTGMDPEARRNMWTVIEKLSAKRCVVLVTHSMEEVEALCTRMGVMVSGRLQCIGSAQHLKSRFGMGYQVEIRTVPARVADCIALCEGTMSPLTVEEVHGGFVRLRVSNAVDLATAFSALESHKAELEIVDYSISQCTLEQVFLKFAKDQDEETGAVDGLLDNAPTSAVMTASGPQVTEPGPETSHVGQFPQTGNDDVPNERARVEAALAGSAQIVGIENEADADNRGGHPTVRSEVIVVQDMEDVLDVSDGAF